MYKTKHDNSMCNYRLETLEALMRNIVTLQCYTSTSRCQLRGGWEPLGIKMENLNLPSIVFLGVDEAIHYTEFDYKF